MSGADQQNLGRLPEQYADEVLDFERLLPVSNTWQRDTTALPPRPILPSQQHHSLTDFAIYNQTSSGLAPLRTRPSRTDPIIVNHEAHAPSSSSHSAPKSVDTAEQLKLEELDEDGGDVVQARPSAIPSQSQAHRQARTMQVTQPPSWSQTSALLDMEGETDLPATYQEWEAQQHQRQSQQAPLPQQSQQQTAMQQEQLFDSPRQAPLSGSDSLRPVDAATIGAATQPSTPQPVLMIHPAPPVSTTLSAQPYPQDGMLSTFQQLPPPFHGPNPLLNNASSSPGTAQPSQQVVAWTPAIGSTPQSDVMPWGSLASATAVQNSATMFISKPSGFTPAYRTGVPSQFGPLQWLSSCYILVASLAYLAAFAFQELDMGIALLVACGLSVLSILLGMALWGLTCTRKAPVFLIELAFALVFGVQGLVAIVPGPTLNARHDMVVEFMPFISGASLAGLTLASMVFQRPLTLQFIQEQVPCCNHRNPAVLLLAHKTTFGLLLVFSINTLLYMVPTLQGLEHADSVNQQSSSMNVAFRIAVPILTYSLAVASILILPEAIVVDHVVSSEGFDDVSLASLPYPAKSSQPWRNVPMMIRNPLAFSVAEGLLMAPVPDSVLYQIPERETRPRLVQPGAWSIPEPLIPRVEGGAYGSGHVGVVVSPFRQELGETLAVVRHAQQGYYNAVAATVRSMQRQLTQEPLTEQGQQSQQQQQVQLYQEQFHPQQQHHQQYQQTHPPQQLPQQQPNEQQLQQQD